MLLKPEWKSTEIKQPLGSPYTQPLTHPCLVRHWETTSFRKFLFCIIPAWSDWGVSVPRHRGVTQVIQGVWDCREKDATHQKTPGAEMWQEKQNEVYDHWHQHQLEIQCTGDMPLTCRGCPVCVGLSAEVRVGPSVPSNYTAVYSVWRCLSAVAVAATKRHHTGYLNPSSLGPAHLWNKKHQSEMSAVQKHIHKAKGRSRHRGH